jgi:hypothetical protein
MKNQLNQPIRTTGLRHYPPCVWTPTQVVNYVTGKDGKPTQSSSDGKSGWVPARPMNSFQTLRGRLKLAVAVFRGQADVLQWEQGQ